VGLTHADSKAKPRDLAILGGERAFQEPLHVGRPNLGDREAFLARIADMLDRRWLTNDGPFVQELESRIADVLGVKHCVAVCNGTVALEIAIRAAGMSGEVIVPSFTFIATAHALQWQGITPVFCDIDPLTHTIDPRSVERLLSPRTTGILGVHVWGNPCDIDGLARIADQHRLSLLFDAAHAFGCSYRGKMIGTFGDAEILSFHATKFFNCLEGGAIATNHDAIAQQAKLMRNFGFAGYDNVVSLGTNGKLNEVCAAMGLTNLDSLEEFIRVNDRNDECYRRELVGIPGVTLLAHDRHERHNYQYVVMEVDSALASLTRDQLLKVLWAENVLARRYFYPGCHRMEPYRSRPPRAQRRLPETERVSDRVLTLPTGTSVGPEDIALIARIIRLAVGHAGELLASLDTPARGPASRSAAVNAPPARVRT
jgi:dTDP-4-amino-4,6-dideoxygalactose transaminase